MTDPIGQGNPAGPGPGQFPQQGPAGQPHLLPNQAPPKKRKIWRWVLGISFVFFALIGGCTFFVVGLVSGPLDATNAYFDAIEQGEYAEAYELICQEKQEEIPFAEWQPVVEQENVTGHNFTFVESTNGATTVSGTVEVDGSTENITFGLVKEDDDWKVCGSN